MSSYDSSKDCLPHGYVIETEPDFGGSFRLDFQREIEKMKSVDGWNGDDQLNHANIAGASVDEIAHYAVDWILDEVHLHVISNW